MKKNDFLTKLVRALIELNEDDILQITEYYTELINDGVEQGLTEDEAIEKFGLVEDIAARIKEDYGKFAKADMTKKTWESSYESAYEAAGPVHTIRIKAECTPVIVRPSSSKTARVIYSPREGMDRISFHEDGGVLTFEHSINKFYLWRFIGINIREQPITVEIPVDFDGEITLITSNAYVTAKDMNHLKSLRMESSNSSLTAENLTSLSTKLKSSNGKLNMHRLKGRTLDATTSNARIGADGCVMDESITFTTSNGKIEIEDIASKNIELVSSNGAIKGTISGDMREYAIYSKTSNASNNLPNMDYPDEDKTLKVKTSNAKIDIKFVR